MGNCTIRPICVHQFSKVVILRVLGGEGGIKTIVVTVDADGVNCDHGDYLWRLVSCSL